MIENLNLRTFAPYGRVFEDNMAFGAHRAGMLPLLERVVSVGRTPGGFCTCKDHVIGLDYVDGMTALCILDPETGNSRAYYLDKPVLLSAGIAFALIACGDQGQARLYLPREDALSPYPGEPVVPALWVTPRMTIPRIYTFFYQEKPKGFFFRGEKHAPYELMYVDHGSLHCIVGGQNFELRQHDLLICLPEQWHIQYADPDTSVAFVTVSFDMEGMDADGLGGRARRASPAVIRLLEEMLAQQRAPGPWSGDSMLLSLGRLILALVAVQEKPAALFRHDTIAESNENKLVDEALRFIEENLTRSLSVSEVAAAVCASPSYLAVLFRRHLRMTPTAYIHKLKLEEGRRLIHQGNMTITQVSQHLGFATLQHFSRLFKAYFGLGPREYARSLR